MIVIIMKEKDDGMITYEQRLARIVTSDDIQREIDKSEAYAKRLKGQVKAFNGLFADKLKLHERAKEAAAISRQLKLNYYLIEDALGLK